MKNTDLKKQILELTFLIKKKEENYEAELSAKPGSGTLKQLLENIKKLKKDLQVLIDKESVERTGHLPKVEQRKIIKNKTKY